MMFNSHTDELDQKIKKQREEIIYTAASSRLRSSNTKYKKSLEQLTAGNAEIFSIVIHNGESISL